MERSIKLPGSYNPESIEAPAQGDVLFCMDGVVPYLRLKVTANSRTWVLDRSFGGKHFKRRLGDAKSMSVIEARIEAYNWAREMEAGKVPETVKKRTEKVLRAAVKVNAIFKEYHEKHLIPQAETASEIERGVELYWGAIKNTLVADLTALQLTAWVAEIGKAHGNATANKQLRNLKACIRWGAGKQLCELPVFFAERLKAIQTLPEEAKSSFLRKDQVEPLEKALAPYSEVIRDAIMMMLWTSQRKTNVLSMEWAEIDFQHKQWLVPASKTKTKKPYTINLTAKALEILMRRRNNDSPFVFPSKTSESGHLENPNTAWLDIRIVAGVPDLKLHGLRHTGGTWLAHAGAPSFEIKRQLNHSTIKTSERYVHEYGPGSGWMDRVQEA